MVGRLRVNSQAQALEPHTCSARGSLYCGVACRLVLCNSVYRPELRVRFRRTSHTCTKIFIARADLRDHSQFTSYGARVGFQFGLDDLQKNQRLLLLEQKRHVGGSHTNHELLTTIKTKNGKPSPIPPT